jgi:hypothetical protein
MSTLTSPSKEKKEYLMPELPIKKVGIISCSGEEIPEGTISRLATLQVLEKLRPSDTVTICLPLFLAGGEGDRAFAKFYPTIAVDGCSKRCAYFGTARYSNQPAASIVISEIINDQHLPAPHGRRTLDSAGIRAVEITAQKVAEAVDTILGKRWERREGQFEPANSITEEQAIDPLTCSCGSGIPVQKLHVNDQDITLIALPLIIETFLEGKKSPSPETSIKMLKMLKIYNRIDPDMEEAIQKSVSQEYSLCFERKPNE